MAWVDDRAWTTMQTQRSGNKHIKHVWDSYPHTMSYVGTREPEKTEKYVLGHICVTTRHQGSSKRVEPYFYRKLVIPSRWIFFSQVPALWIGSRNVNTPTVASQIPYFWRGIWAQRSQNWREGSKNGVWEDACLRGRIQGQQRRPRIGDGISMDLGWWAKTYWWEVSLDILFTLSRITDRPAGISGAQDGIEDDLF